MENITSTAELKKAIQLLEVEQVINAQMLKEQFNFTYERIKPVNILRGTLKDITSSPFLIDNILGTAVGLATGYLSKKMVVGVSGNIIRKLFGYVMQVGVTNAVAQHPDTIKSIGQYIFQHIFRNKNRRQVIEDR
jgi:hypothetical protein